MQTGSKSIKSGNKLQTNNNALKYDPNVNAEVLTGKTNQLNIPEEQTRSETLKTANNLLTTCTKSVSEDNNRAALNSKPNPLFIPEITHQILDFLKLSDIKNCRLVCQQWSQVAETLQQRLSVVKIKPQQACSFLETFPNAQQCKVFTSFEIERWGSAMWRQYRLVDFFKKWSQNMKELVLFARVYGPGYYDLTPLVPSTLSKLKIQMHERQRIISTDKICNIRVLYIDNCIINITPGVILNPQEIHLGNVVFLKDKMEIPNVLINSLLNFAVLKNASFNTFNSMNSRNITLDLQGSHSLDVLRLHDSVTVLNLETSRWEIKKFIISGISNQIIEMGTVHMKYKDLDVVFGKHFHVSLLPNGIEKLKLDLQGDYRTRESPQIYGQHEFPALTKLHLTLPNGINFSPLGEHFTFCANLTTLCVEGCTSGTNLLKTSSIHKSVNNLHLKNVKIILDQSREIKSLIIHDYNPDKEQHSSVTKIAKGLHVKNLMWLRDDKTRNGYLEIFDEERGNLIKNLIDLKFDNLVLGLFKQAHDSLFETSYFFPLVDTQGMYYLFQRGEKGKAISKWEVEQLSK